MKTILIADDLDINFLLLQTYLKSDFAILRAHDGVEAVDVFRVHKPDLVLMDCKMPNMDGLEATKLIHDISLQTPVIMQSAYAYEEDRKNASEAGCIDFLAKPITKQALMNMINKYLE